MLASKREIEGEWCSTAGWLDTYLLLVMAAALLLTGGYRAAAWHLLSIILPLSLSLFFLERTKAYLALPINPLVNEKNIKWSSNGILHPFFFFKDSSHEEEERCNRDFLPKLILFTSWAWGPFSHESRCVLWNRAIFGALKSCWNRAHQEWFRALLFLLLAWVLGSSSLL